MKGKQNKVILFIERTKQAETNTNVLSFPFLFYILKKLNITHYRFPISYC